MTALEKTLLKGLGVAGLGILGFLSVMIVNDHSNLTGVLQWQTDYGKTIDDIDLQLKTHWQSKLQADTTVSTL